MKKPAEEVVITGGPCAGKSSGLAYLYKRLESYGMRPLLVPEIATLTILGGIHPKNISPVDFQAGIIDLQLKIEDHFIKMAQALPSDSRPVLICDRGTMDGKAYCTQREWTKVLRTLGKNEVELRDTRYKAVIHMVTAAQGAEAFYTLENNTARWETPTQARQKDKRLQTAWLAHPHHRIVGNENDFSHKINQVGKLVLEALGLPEPIEEERKFLVHQSAPQKLRQAGIKLAAVEIEQTYLIAPPGEERRLRRRSQGAFSAYFYCTKIPLSKTKRVEQEVIISEADYSALLPQRDPTRNPIRKTRYCYFYKNQFQELDVYRSPKLPYATLEVETDGKIYLPPCFKNAQEITGEKKYANATLALIS